MRSKKLLSVIGVVAISAAYLYAGSPNQHTKVFRFFAFQGAPTEDGSVVQGSSAKLTRSADAVWLNINTTDLQPGAYTVWWVVFNNPAMCSGSCGADDFANPAVAASVFFATGGVVGRGGTGHFRAHVEEGDVSAVPGQHLFGPGLMNAEGAEIHIVIRYHGPVAPHILEKQISTFGGGCMGPAGEEDPVVADRIFPCYDPQAAVFPAP